MLTVTEAASAHLAEILTQAGFPDDTAIRLVHEGGRIGMQPDNERPGDTTFEHNGRVVLVLDEQVAQLLADDQLDMEGARLTLRPAQEAP